MSLERPFRERADQLVGLRPSGAAGDHELQVRADRELARDVQRVRDDREPAAGRGRSRDLGRRRAAGEPDDRTVGRPGAPPRGRSGPSPSGGAPTCSAAGSSYITSLATAPPWVRASMRCSSRSCRSRRIVASDTSEPLGQRADVDGAVGREHLEDLAQPLRSSHGAEYTRRPSLRARRSICIDRAHESALECALVSETAQEVASQPDAWRRAAALAPEVAAVLPAAGERVAAVGCGTSLYIASAFAALREAGGHGRDRRVPRLGVPARTSLRPGARDQPQRHHLGGRRTARRPRRSSHLGDHRGRRLAGRSRSPTTS